MNRYCPEHDDQKLLYCTECLDLILEQQRQRLDHREWLAKQMDTKVHACKALAASSKLPHLQKYWFAKAEAFEVAAAFIRQCYPDPQNPEIPIVKEVAAK